MYFSIKVVGRKSALIIYSHTTRVRCFCCCCCCCEKWWENFISPELKIGESKERERERKKARNLREYAKNGRQLNQPAYNRVAVVIIYIYIVFPLCLSLQYTKLESRETNYNLQARTVAWEIFNIVSMFLLYIYTVKLDF